MTSARFAMRVSKVSDCSYLADMQTHITVPAGSGARRPSGGAIAQVRPHDWAAVVLGAAGGFRGGFFLPLPRGRQSVVRLAALLQPRAGQRTLEIGPGVGVYSLPIATALLPDGRLDVLDAPEEMLGRLTTRAPSPGGEH